ncbi:MAG: 50S ribosomal protein L21 [Desulfohalobiaceae bacterium]
MYAIVATGGKQYRVREGQVINVEKLGAEAGSDVVLEKVLLVGEGEDVKIGTPYVEDAAINCQVLENKRDRKIIVFKHKRRKDYRKKAGHRQQYTRLKVTSIQA